jgi:hypothetical protein
MVNNLLGEVSNTEEVIEAIAKYSKTTRVFTLGIDAASKHLVNGMAHAGTKKYSGK